MTTHWKDINTVVGYRPERFTTAVYQEVVAGKPRMSGAEAVLRYFNVPDAQQRASEYADCKQHRLIELIDAGEFSAFPDALRLVLALRARGVRLAAASSSKNANRFMALIPMARRAREVGLSEAAVVPGLTLLDLFDANVCGRDLPHGKPHPALFLLAAQELGATPSSCVVIEDAPSGIQAARAGNMAALGIARFDDAVLLADAGADLVVETLDQVDAGALAQGRLAKVSVLP
jgi:beta-phosphoglucomutase-like phosphatase (HAD superfamily)